MHFCTMATALYLSRRDLAESWMRDRQKTMMMLLGMALLAARSGDGGLWQEARDKEHRAWHRRDNMRLELDAGLEKISCLNKISIWIFIIEVLRVVPEWLVKRRVSVAISVQIYSKEWDYTTTSMQEGLQPLWYQYR